MTIDSIYLAVVACLIHLLVLYAINKNKEKNKKKIILTFSILMIAITTTMTIGAFKTWNDIIKSKDREIIFILSSKYWFHNILSSFPTTKNYSGGIQNSYIAHG